MLDHRKYWITECTNKKNKKNNNNNYDNNFYKNYNSTTTQQCSIGFFKGHYIEKDEWIFLCDKFSHTMTSVARLHGFFKKLVSNIMLRAFQQCTDKGASYDWSR